MTVSDPSPAAGSTNNDNNPGQEATRDVQNEGNASWVPRPKRIACVVCRKRKLRCDGKKPSCGSCARLGHDCAYNEVRKKSGPKRGYVKQLEARLAQVETLLKSQDHSDVAQNPSAGQDGVPQLVNVSMPSSNILPNPTPRSTVPPDSLRDGSKLGGHASFPSFSDEFSWEMVSLGLEEPLPPQKVINELNEIYFRKIHPTVPIIHRPRYLAAMNLAPNMRPPVCLRYIIWALAANTTDKYTSLHPHFYQRARKYAQLDEMKGFGEAVLTVGHAQCWNLIGMYEFKMMFFPRAWTSCGHATRLCLMLGLHRQDGIGLDVKQCLPPPRDWTEREERRRTFWASFCQDRYGSIGTGWPMIIDERDILTNLPASDQAFFHGKPEKTHTLAEVLAGTGTSTLSSYGSVVLVACLFGRNLHHLHRTSSKDRDHDLNGDFWKRHRTLDNIILSTSLSLPDHLQLPQGINDPCVVFTNMCIHTSTICLHQAAIFKAEKNDMPAQISAESKRRCIIAADQITNIMKMASHTDLSMVNPFLAFCLYVASRILIQYLKSRPEDQPVLSSLRFLLSALNALKARNPLTESFLVQLDVDLEASGLGIRIDLSQGSGSEIHPKRRRPAPGETCAAILRPPLEENQSAPQLSAMQDQSSASPSFSSLPTRQKPSTGNPGTNTATHTVAGVNAQETNFSSSFYLDIDNSQIGSLVMELDGSTEVESSSDRQHSGSNHPTPGTNKSSNSSFSPHSGNMEYSSPPKQQQQQQQPPPNTQNTQNFAGNLYTATKATNASMAMGTAPSYFDSTFNSSTNNNNNLNTGATTSFPHYSHTVEVPIDPLSSQNPFSITSSWNFPVRQPDTVEPGETGMVPEADLALPSFDGVNWAPTPSVTDWDNWTNQ